MVDRVHGEPRRGTKGVTEQQKGTVINKSEKKKRSTKEGESKITMYPNSKPGSWNTDEEGLYSFSVDGLRTGKGFLDREGEA